MKKGKLILLLSIIATFCFIGACGHNHTFASEYSYDETHHYYSSTCGHDVVEGKALHEYDTPQTLEDGRVLTVCKVCGYKNYVNHEHTFASEYSYDETHHYYPSTCGHNVVSGKGAHSFDDGTVQPNGDTLYVCEVCGYNYVVQSTEVRAYDIELEALKTPYVRTDSLEDYLKCRVVYTDNTYSDWLNVSSNNIETCVIEGGNLKATVSVVVSNFKLSKSIEIPVSDNPISVSTLLTSNVDNEYMLNGIVSYFATNIDKNETIIIDKNTGDAISVVGLGTGDVYNGTFAIDGISVGDEVIIPVKLLKNATSTNSANSNKIYAEYVGGNNLSLAVISKNNSLNYKTADLIIDSSDDLSQFLSTSNRANNVYKTVKFRGQINYITNNNYELFEFFMYDKTVDSVDDIAIDGLIPSISNSATYFSLGKTYIDAMFDKSGAPSTELSNLKSIIKEFTAMYIGGNNEYAQFILLSEESIASVTPTLCGITFIKPDKTAYFVGESIDLTGSSLTAHYDLCQDETVSVTNSMLSLTSFTTAGKNILIEGLYGGYTFEFNVDVFSSPVKSIELLSVPTVSTYSHRDNLDTIDFSGAKLKVTFEDGSSEEVDITKEMISLEDSDAWKIGIVNYKASYLEKTVNVPIEYVNTAKTISQFKTGTLDQEYDLTGIVVGPIITGNYIELLIREKNTDNYISIIRSGVAGTSSAPKLDTNFVNYGDEIAVKVLLKKETANGGNKNRYWCDGIGVEQFTSSLIVLSKGNDITFNLESATEISTQQQFKDFLYNTTDRAYKLVKLCGIKAYRVNQRYSAIFFEGATTSEIQYGSRWVVLDRTTTNAYVDLSTYFPNASSTSSSIESPATTEYDIYAFYCGGNSTYLSFVILDSSWFVPKTNA